MTKKQAETNQILVFMSDFGLTERFVATMKGVALTVASDLKIHDLTHQIEPFNIAEASQMLAGTILYWPEGTVFVAVVDPGVGTVRKSIVARTISGHFVVTPDNGTLSGVADVPGIESVREIDESKNRLPGSADSHTFHGRDIYAYTGSRLAAGVIRFDEVGPAFAGEVVRITNKLAARSVADSIQGSITKIEKPYGNIVTNIVKSLLDEMDISPGAATQVRIEIMQADKVVHRKIMPYVLSFGYVPEGEPLIYSDSSQRIGLAVNGGNFAAMYGVGAGEEWVVNISRADTASVPDEI